MQSLGDIPVVVSRNEPARTGGARALLSELAGLLETLAGSGEGGSIDLASLPLAPEEYRQLRQMLGEGAVIARVEAGGTTEVRETGCPGAWWVTHANEAGAVIAELIEVCVVPAILLADTEEVAEGLSRLQQAIAQKGVQ